MALGGAAESDAWAAARTDAAHRLDGRNVDIDIRWSAGNAANRRKFASELVGLAPDVILAIRNSSVGPILEATSAVPIVFTIVIDPVGAGYVESLARPSGNALCDPAIPAGIG